MCRTILLLIGLTMVMRGVLSLVVTEKDVDRHENVKKTLNSNSSPRNSRRYMDSIQKIAKKHFKIKDRAPISDSVTTQQSVLHKNNNSKSAVRHPDKPKPKIPESNLFDQIIPHMKMRIPMISGRVQDSETKQTLKDLYHELGALELMLSQL